VFLSSVLIALPQLPSRLNQSITHRQMVMRDGKQHALFAFPSFFFCSSPRTGIGSPEHPSLHPLLPFRILADLFLRGWKQGGRHFLSLSIRHAPMHRHASIDLQLPASRLFCLHVVFSIHSFVQRFTHTFLPFLSSASNLRTCTHVFLSIHDLLMDRQPESNESTV